MNPFDSPEWERKFRSILADIRMQKCVVMLGPEAVRYQGNSLRKGLRESLFSSNAEDIAHYYERDEIYLFRDKIAKEDIQREVGLFYKKHTLDSGIQESPLLELIRLKAHTIISLNPDSFLSELAFKYGIKHRSAFFHHGGAAVVDVESPTAELPLFYNLFGSLERDTSLVLDYDDLFSLLHCLFGSPGLPPRLILELRQAKHFLFVGFDFDKWYSQLLLRLLSGEKAIRKFVIDKSNKNENTTLFLVKQFGVEFIEDENAFLKELFYRAENEGLMRPVLYSDTPESTRIRHLLGLGNVPGALQVMLSNPKWSDTGALISARFQELKDREARRVLDARERTLEYNRIVDSIIESIKNPVL